MEIKQILLILMAGEPPAAGVEIAGRLARQHGAVVEGVCLFAEPQTALADNYAIGSEGVADVLAHRAAKVRALTASAGGAFDATIRAHGMSCGWSVGAVIEWGEALTPRARHADLVVIAAAPDVADMRRLAETLALASGAPVLLAPPEGANTRFNRVVVAWNGSREARRAVDEGLIFLRSAPHVRVVVVEEAGRSVTQADAEALLRRLSLHGVEAELVRVSAMGRSTGRALTEACAEFDADLLVMGAFGRPRAAEVILGGATRTLIAHAKTPTLLAH
jgi:nucleotide-binding universal stress UspA family protein